MISRKQGGLTRVVWELSTFDTPPAIKTDHQKPSKITRDQKLLRYCGKMVELESMFSENVRLVPGEVDFSTCNQVGEGSVLALSL